MQQWWELTFHSVCNLVGALPVCFRQLLVRNLSSSVLSAPFPMAVTFLWTRRHGRSQLGQACEESKQMDRCKSLSQGWTSAGPNVAGSESRAQDCHWC